MSVKNAKQLPRVYFGLHMVEGVAEYREPGQQPYRIFIGEEAIKNMDVSFQGRPVYVRHVDEVDLDKLQTEADGYVSRSFFNQADGKHWVEFMVISDRGHEAIRNGWKLSNAYIPKMTKGGGQWHGVDYSKEIALGEYEHLAIVPNPRYAESVIMTPEQFKEYNAGKEIELKRLANSKGVKSMFNFFKRAKVEDQDLEHVLVTLPKSKVEASIGTLINEMDGYHMEMQKPEHMANGEHMVEVGEEKMKVNDLVAKHVAMCQELADLKAKHPEPSADEKKANDEKAAKEAEEKAAAEKKANEEKEASEKKAAEEKKSNEANFEKIKNAEAEALKNRVVELSSDKVARGQARYGSN